MEKFGRGEGGKSERGERWRVGRTGLWVELFGFELLACLRWRLGLVFWIILLGMCIGAKFFLMSLFLIPSPLEIVCRFHWNFFR